MVVDNPAPPAPEGPGAWVPPPGKPSRNTHPIMMYEGHKRRMLNKRAKEHIAAMDLEPEEEQPHVPKPRPEWKGPLPKGWGLPNPIKIADIPSPADRELLKQTDDLLLRDILDEVNEDSDLLDDYSNIERPDLYPEWWDRSQPWNEAGEYQGRTPEDLADYEDYDSSSSSDEESSSSDEEGDSITITEVPIEEEEEEEAIPIPPPVIHIPPPKARMVMTPISYKDINSESHLGYVRESGGYQMLRNFRSISEAGGTQALIQTPGFRAIVPEYELNTGFLAALIPKDWYRPENLYRVAELLYNVGSMWRNVLVIYAGSRGDGIVKQPILRDGFKNMEQSIAALKGMEAVAGPTMFIGAWIEKCAEMIIRAATVNAHPGKASFYLRDWWVPHSGHPEEKRMYIAAMAIYYVLEIISEWCFLQSTARLNWTEEADHALDGSNRNIDMKGAATFRDEAFPRMLYLRTLPSDQLREMQRQARERGADFYDNGRLTEIANDIVRMNPDAEGLVFSSLPTSLRSVIAFSRPSPGVDFDRQNAEAALRAEQRRREAEEHEEQRRRGKEQYEIRQRLEEEQRVRDQEYEIRRKQAEIIQARVQEEKQRRLDEEHRKAQTQEKTLYEARRAEEERRMDEELLETNEFLKKAEEARIRKALEEDKRKWEAIERQKKQNELLWGKVIDSRKQ